MGFRSLVSLFMVAIPIGATLGVLLGVNTYRAARGEQPLFTDNTYSTQQYCQKSYGITPGSVGQQYTLNPNQWGWNEGDPGGLCMDVTSYANSTYATLLTAPKWSVTWKYPPGPTDQPVHAFPNIRLDADDVFPSLVHKVASVSVDVVWTYGVGRKPATAIDEVALTGAELNANVAVDMFLDSDQAKSQDTTRALYEVMVWLARFGSYTDPIGYPTVVATRAINGTVFSLYSGTNKLQQHVLTWVAEAPTPIFSGDIAPLLHGLDQYNGPRGIDYFGYMGFGSETLWSGNKVTFDVPSLKLNVQARR